MLLLCLQLHFKFSEGRNLFLLFFLYLPVLVNEHMLTGTWFSVVPLFTELTEETEDGPIL